MSGGSPLLSDLPAWVPRPPSPALGGAGSVRASLSAVRHPNVLDWFKKGKMNIGGPGMIGMSDALCKGKRVER